MISHPHIDGVMEHDRPGPVIPDDEELMRDPFPEHTVEEVSEWCYRRIRNEPVPVSDDVIFKVVTGKSYLDPMCGFLLGLLYENGIGTGISLEDAEEHICSAARNGNADACYYIASVYRDGAFGRKDMFRAAKWFSKAADMGIAEAGLFYGEACMELYSDTGIGFYGEEALEALWDLAYDIDEANADIARCYMRGIGTEISLDVPARMIDVLETDGYDVTGLKEEYEQVRQRIGKK